MTTLRHHQFTLNSTFRNPVTNTNHSTQFLCKHKSCRNSSLCNRVEKESVTSSRARVSSGNDTHSLSSGDAALEEEKKKEEKELVESLPSFFEFITSERVKVVSMVGLALALCNADIVVMSVAILPLSLTHGWSRSFAGIVQIYHVNLKQAAWFSAFPWIMMAILGYFAAAFSDKLIRDGTSVTVTGKIMQEVAPEYAGVLHGGSK